MIYFNCISSEGIILDEFNTTNYIRWKVNDLKEEGYSSESIMEFILADDSFEGDEEKLVEFLKKLL